MISAEQRAREDKEVTGAEGVAEERLLVAVAPVAPALVLLSFLLLCLVDFSTAMDIQTYIL